MASAFRRNPASSKRFKIGTLPCPTADSIFIPRYFLAIPMNVPNRLTVSRFALTAIFLAVVFSKTPFGETISLAIFIVASLTDYFDGKIARRDKLITNFGILMDPLADKILTCSAFIAFVGLGWVSAWMVVVIVARELEIGRAHV